MKHVLYQDRKLTLEDAYCDVPAFHTAIGEKVCTSEVGECWMTYYVHVRLDEYFSYLSTLKESDWKPYIIHDEPIRNKVYTAMFLKGERYLDISFYDFDGSFLPPKFFLTVGLLPASFGTDVELLVSDVPSIESEGEKDEAFQDKGGGFYAKTVCDIGIEEYYAYLEKVKAAGFQMVLEEPSVLDKRIYTAPFTKDERILEVTFVSPIQEMYVTVGKGRFSSHLSGPGNVCFKPGLKTTVQMLEMWNFGNSFVIRLKNGHFLINDGGSRCEAPYLLDYLDSLTGENEIPVVEGWFISHAHGDHIGVLIELALDPQWKDRVRVEGIYFNEPSLELYMVDGGALGATHLMSLVSRNIRNMNGEPVPFFRPMLGERYYFTDITVDILMSQERIDFANYSGDLNDTSTWLLLTIEGQKVLLGGDGDKSGRKYIMSVFPSNFMVVDVMSQLHHGFNTHNDFTNYCHAKTVLFTCYGDGPKIKRKENEYLKARAEEWYSWGEGTVVLTFPYHVGEAERKPHFDFSKYNEGEQRPTMPNSEEKRS